MLPFTVTEGVAGLLPTETVIVVVEVHPLLSVPVTVYVVVVTGETVIVAVV
jgi:hypothetical protein